MTYAKPRDLYDVIVTCVSQAVHFMTSCTPTRQQLRSAPYDFPERGVRSRGEGGVEPYDHHQKGVTETVQNEAKEQKGGFLNVLLGMLGASVLGNILTGQGINRSGEGVVRPGYDRHSSKNKKMNF